jgi:toxin ParE1/3/4
MGKYTLTKKAVEDLGDIWNYTFDRWSEQQADRYYQRLLDTCQEAAENPERGKSYDGVHGELKGLRVRRHIIFFRKLNNQEVEITRILHGRMDLKNESKNRVSADVPL